MGPKPRLRLPASTAIARSAPVVITSPSRVAPVGAPSPRRAPTVPTVPLPADTCVALSGVAKALRNVPREAIHNPPELFVWLNRQAKALERLRDTPMPVPTSPQVTQRTSARTPALSSPPRFLSARERAEAVFSGMTPPTSGATSAPPSPPTSAEAIFRTTSGALIRPRIVLDRKGCGVRVEVRRAREAGQLEMPV